MSKQEHDKDDNTPQGSAPSHNNASQKAAEPAKGDTAGNAATAGDGGKPDAAGSASGSETPSRFKATGANSSSAGTGGAAAPAATGNGGKRNGILLAVVIVLLLLLLAGLVWGGLRLKTQQQQLASLSQQVQDTQSLRGEVQAREQDINTLRNQLEQTNQSVERVLKDLAASQQTDSREWLYAEVEYLLRLANQRLQLERDVQGAQSLLRAADERLQQADNPAFLPVRRAIHSELAALDSVPDVDQSGIYLQLAAEAEQLSRLPLSQDTQALSAQVDDGSTYSGGWRAQLARMGNQLKDLITVRHHDKVLEALITPEQEGYLRQNVRLQLEQAQLALLKGEPRVYRAGIARASDLVEGYYKTNDEGVQKALGRLDELAGQAIHPKLPDISASLTQLRDVLAKRFGEPGADTGASSQPADNGQQPGAGSAAPHGAATDEQGGNAL